MNERASVDIRLVFVKYLFIVLFAAYLLTYLTGKMEGFPTVRETFEFIVHFLSRFFQLIKLVAGLFKE